MSLTREVNTSCLSEKKLSGYHKIVYDVLIIYDKRLFMSDI